LIKLLWNGVSVQKHKKEIGFLEQEEDLLLGKFTLLV